MVLYFAFSGGPSGEDSMALPFPHEYRSLLSHIEFLTWSSITSRTCEQLLPPKVEERLQHV